MTTAFNHLLTMASNHPSSRADKTDFLQQQQFDYGNLDNETKLAVEQHASEIKSLIRQTAQDIVSIGQKLIDVKEKLKHGNFRNWLKAEFNWSMSSATKFMQVSEQFKDVNFADLNFSTSALYILAAPSTPEKAREHALHLASHGEQITYSLAKVIVNRYRDICDIQNSEPNPQPQSNLKMDSQDLSSMETQTIDVAAQAVVDEAGVERDASIERPSTSIEPKESDSQTQQESDRLQNFKITYEGISFMVQGKPEEITALFEQMQRNPNFAREIFAKAQLLIDSETDIKKI